jgi:hypothetical protein
MHKEHRGHVLDERGSCAQATMNHPNRMLTKSSVRCPAQVAFL